MADLTPAGIFGSRIRGVEVKQWRVTIRREVVEKPFHPIFDPPEYALIRQYIPGQLEGSGECILDVPISRADKVFRDIEALYGHPIAINGEDATIEVLIHSIEMNSPTMPGIATRRNPYGPTADPPEQHVDVIVRMRIRPISRRVPNGKAD